MDDGGFDGSNDFSYLGPVRSGRTLPLEDDVSIFVWFATSGVGEGMRVDDAACFVWECSGDIEFDVDARAREAPRFLQMADRLGAHEIPAEAQEMEARKSGMEG